MKINFTKILIATLAIISGSLYAAPKMFGFGKPAVMVAADLDAYFKDSGKQANKDGLEAYADAILNGGKVTHVFWYVSQDTRGKLTEAGVDTYKVLIDRTHEKGVEAWISIKVSDIAGPTLALWKQDVQSGLLKAARTTADAADLADGYEFDFLSGITDWSGEAPTGEKPFDQYDVTSFLNRMWQEMCTVTKRKEIPLAYRVPADRDMLNSCELSPLFSTGKMVIPCLTPEQSGKRAIRGSLWHEADRIGPRVVPGISVSSVSLEELSGWINSMRGWNFPGIFLAGIEPAPDGMKQAILSAGAADVGKTAAGTRKIVLYEDSSDHERYPQKLDRNWTYEFSLQRGTIVEKPVKVTVRYAGNDAAPESIVLNGRKSLSSASDGKMVTYEFATDAVIDRRNSLRIPAVAGKDVTVEGPVEMFLSAAADAYKGEPTVAYIKPGAQSPEPKAQSPKDSETGRAVSMNPPQPKTQKEVEDWLMQTNEVAKLSQKKDAALPDVLILGDSISLGYTPVVQQMMAGKANITRPPTNCGSSYHYIVPGKDGVVPMKKWVGDGHYKVITVNFGIWDNHYNLKAKDKAGKVVVNLWNGNTVADKLAKEGKPADPMSVMLPSRKNCEIRTPINEYETNLREILGYLKQHADKVVFCLTTPVPEWLSIDSFGRIRVYNEMAEAVCAEMGVDTIDLYSIAEQNADKYRADKVHFTPEGYKLLAEEVVKGIEKNLQ